MHRRYSFFPVVLAAAAMLVLILDSKTALEGASDGIAICIRTLIPTLLPFFVLSSILTKHISGKKSRILSPLGKLCGIPVGQEFLFLIGILGGYPIGAQSIAAACQSGSFDEKDAERMLGFCNNAGPSFIFGIAASLFSRRWIGWIIWMIHILSAICVGILLPDKSRSEKQNPYPHPPETPIIPQSIKALAAVCCWVTLIRVLIAFLRRWFLWMLPSAVSATVVGIIELTNGCCALFDIGSESVRFVLCCAMLSMGGLCVLAQTISVTSGLGQAQYIHGKLLQTLISTIFAAILQPVLFRTEQFPCLTVISASTAVFIMILLIYTRKTKKEVAFSSKILYNGVN